MSQDALLETDLSQLSIHDSGISLIEKFPRELLWKIFDMTLESIHNIRLISRAIKSEGDQYLLQRKTIHFVNHVVFDFQNVSGDPHMLCFTIGIDKRFGNLFDLRLNLRRPTNELKRRLKRSEGMYYMELNVVEDMDNLMVLSEVIGGEIGIVVVDIMTSNGVRPTFNRSMSSCVSKFLEDTHFDQLQCYSNDLPDDQVAFVLELINDHKFEKLYLMVKYVSADPVETLLHFSSLVKSIYIVQKQNYELKRNTNEFNPPHFFGKRGFNWAPTFVKMMQRKCEKLNIVVYANYAHYLQKEHADWLREQLPKINKKIWFCTFCECYEEKIEYTDSGSVVLSDKYEDFERFLSVMHSSRLNEQEW